MVFPVERVLAGLRTLDERDPQRRRFGSAVHGYRLEPVLASAEVARFEARHGIVLPADYRAFITLVGNGGAGPYYGVFRLGEMLQGREQAPWSSGGPGQMLGSLNAPFPHQGAWNLDDDELEEIFSHEDDDELIRRYWTPTDGAVPLSEHGCALRDWLVVTGSQAGKMWHDARADQQGWKPITDAHGEHLTFEAWYLRWLDAALAGR